MKIINKESGGFLKRFIIIISIVIIITAFIAIFQPKFDNEEQVAGDCFENPKGEGC